MKTAIEMARKAVNYSPETEYFPILHTKEQIERFAASVREDADKEIAELYEMCLNQAKKIKQYIDKYGELK